MQVYFLSMHALGVRVSGLLSAGLGLEPSFFEGCTSEMAHAMRLLHYSAEVKVTWSGRSFVGLFPSGSMHVDVHSWAANAAEFSAEGLG